MVSMVMVSVHLREANDICCLNQAGKSENLKWGRSDLKFLEFLDCKHIHRNTDLQARLAELVFIHNTTLGPGTGYTPHQLVQGMSSGVPGIYQVPCINKSQAKQPPST